MGINTEQNFIKKIRNDIGEEITYSLAPAIALFILIIIGVALPVMAFGKDSNWGNVAKLLVGIGEPIIIVSMIFSRSFSNTVMIISGIIIWSGLILATFGTVAYFLMKAYLDMF